MANMILCNMSVVGAHSFLFDNLWEKAYYWRYITIVSIFLMIVYKRKVSYFEKMFNNLEKDKKIVRRIFFIFPEVNLKELMKNLINNSCYSVKQINNLKEFENYLNEIENNILSENLKKSAGNLKLALNSGISFLEKYFIKDNEKELFKLKINQDMDSVDEFELHDKILTIITAFESKYLSFMQEVKDEFI